MAQSISVGEVTGGSGGHGGNQGGSGGPGGSVQIITNTYNGSQEPTAEAFLWTIVRWLSDFDFKDMQTDFFEKHTDGTGQWLLETQKFKDWAEGRSNILWCSGDPGVGKTFLASIVVDHLTRFRNETVETVAVACVYCNHKEREKQTVLQLIASILRQLVGHRSAASDNLMRFYRKFHDHRETSPKLRDVTDALRVEIGTYSRVYIIVDALDEYIEDNQGELIEMLRSLSDVKLMFTSRPLVFIEQQLEGVERLVISANNADVQKYIEGRISKTPVLTRYVKANRTLRDDIINEIVSKAKGMFLMAKLYMDDLASKPSITEVRTVLKNLPAGVDATYDKAMERISEQEDNRRIAEQVLQWISYARRRLTYQELQGALAVTRNADMTDINDEDLMDTAIIVDVCAGLVVIDDSQGVVRLVHETTEWYFEEKRTKLFPDAQVDIARACLRYLSIDRFGNTLRPQSWYSQHGFWKRDGSAYSKTAPLNADLFFCYAASYWGYHARGEAEEACKKTALDFLQKTENVASAIDVFEDHIMEGEMMNCSEVHLLAFFGLESTLHDHLKTTIKGDLKDLLGRTPLSYAARNGHESVVRELLKRNDVDVNSEDDSGWTPLSRAAINGHGIVVRELLKWNDVDVNSRDYWDRTPLSRAAENGHESIVRELLKRKDVNINSGDHRDQTPLSRAAINGHEIVVRELLKRNDVNVNSRDYWNRTPLSRAAENGHESIVRELLKRNDVDINSRDDLGWTLLSCAAENGHESIVRELLKRNDVDINSRDHSHQTLLSRAARNGRESIVRELLKRNDVDVNSGDDLGWTPLSRAAINGHEIVVRELLKRNDVDVNLGDDSGWTPLSHAAKYGYESVVRELLKRNDVDVNLGDHSDQTPLSHAAKNGHESVMRELLKRNDVDINLGDDLGWTPLSHAAKNGHESIVRELLKWNDINVNLGDYWDRTPLSCAAENGHESIVKELLKRNDVDVNSGDYWDRTPLSYAAEGGHESVVRELLKRNDININLGDEQGQTPLSYAAENGHESIMRELLKY